MYVHYNVRRILVFELVALTQTMRSSKKLFETKRYICPIQQNFFDEIV